MELKDIYGKREYDTRAIRAGAIQYIQCPTCGAPPGENCRYKDGKPIPDFFACIGRRFEYVAGRGLYYDEPTAIPPEIWIRCKQDRHAECKPHPASCACGWPPDPCECPCHPVLKSTSDVDDLLG